MNLARASILVVLFSAILLFSGVLPYQAVLITGDSMEPTLTEGDVAIVEKTNSVDEGDIVVFYSSEAGEEIAHRVVNETETGLITQGDNNAGTDQAAGIPPVQENQITGKIATINGEPAHVPTGVAVGQILERPQSIGAFLIVISLSYYFLVNGGRRGRENIEEAQDLIRPIMIIVFISTILVILIGATTTPVSVLFVENPTQDQPAVEQVGVEETQIRVEVTSNDPPFSYRVVDAHGEMQIESITEGRKPNQLFVTLTVDGRDTVGSQSGTIEVRHYPRVLPFEVIQTLDSIHPVLASTAVSFVLITPGLLYYVLLIDPKELIREVRRRR